MTTPTATFDPTLPTAKDEVRQTIGDTDVSAGSWDVADETIANYLSRGMSVLAVSARLARDLAAKYARQTDVSVDRQSVGGGASVYAHYRDLATRLEGQLAREGGTPPPSGGVVVNGMSIGGIMVTGLKPSWSPDQIFCGED